MVVSRTVRRPELRSLDISFSDGTARSDERPVCPAVVEQLCEACASGGRHFLLVAFTPLQLGYGALGADEGLQRYPSSWSGVACISIESLPL